MALEQSSISFTKEEWLDDEEMPYETDEGKEGKGSDIIKDEAVKGGSSTNVKCDTTGEFVGKEEVKCELSFNNEGEQVYYNVKVSYDSLSNLQDENPRSAAQMTLACDRCNFVSTSVHDMDNHKKTHPPLFACKRCDFKSDTMKSLNVHLRTHYPYACGVCSFGTFHRLNLQNHMDVHAKKLCPTKKLGPADPRFLALKCRQCDYFGADLEDLNKHVESHQPVKGRESEGGLTNHSTSKHEASCKYCQFDCGGKRALKKHMVEFHNAKSAQLIRLNKGSMFVSKRCAQQFCDLCGLKYAYQFHLDNHLAKAHNAIIPPRPRNTKKRIKRSGSAASRPLLLTGSLRPL